jgi:hypothetical protein
MIYGICCDVILSQNLNKPKNKKLYFVQHISWYLLIYNIYWNTVMSAEFLVFNFHFSVCGGVFLFLAVTHKLCLSFLPPCCWSITKQANKECQITPRRVTIDTTKPTTLFRSTTLLVHDWGHSGPVLVLACAWVIPRATALCRPRDQAHQGTHVLAEY